MLKYIELKIPMDTAIYFCSLSSQQQCVAREPMWRLEEEVLVPNFEKDYGTLESMRLTPYAALGYSASLGGP